MESIKNLFSVFSAGVDAKRLMADAEKLWLKEFGQCHKNYRDAALFAESLLTDAGLENVERIPFPADGKTVFQDKTMPLAWEAGLGRLTVVKSPVEFADPVAADLERHPFHLIKGSASTPPEGVLAGLVTADQMFSGEDARGAVVIAPPDEKNRSDIYRAACDAGALGVVVDWLGARYETPDALQWVNGWTEGPHWHITRGDRRLIGFSVSPRTGDMLRNAARRGTVIVRVQSDGRVFEDEIDVVTGILPGEDERELWLMAHLYEPLSSDNSTGVVSACEIARMIKKFTGGGGVWPPKITLRGVFGPGNYGVGACGGYRGGRLGGKVIGALNLDGLPVSKKFPATARLAPPPSAFSGNYFAEELVRECDIGPGLEITVDEGGGYADDMFLNDSTTGVPTVWIFQPKELWHNSMQTMEAVDSGVFAGFTAAAAAWSYGMLAFARGDASEAAEAFYENSRKKLESEVQKTARGPGEGCIGAVAGEKAGLHLELRLQREERMLNDIAGLSGDSASAAVAEKIKKLRELAGTALSGIKAKSRAGPTPGRDAAGEQALRIAENIIPGRKGAGMPYDLSRAPVSDRRKLPGSIIYGPLARMLSNADGEKNLARLIDEAEWESGVPLSAAEIKKHIGAVEYLSRYGYIETVYESEVKKDDIIRALENAGIRSGDLVFVHSGLSSFGHIRGGADAAISAFTDLLGPEGTLLMPAFTRSFLYFDRMRYKGRTMPFNPERTRDIVVGAMPGVFAGMKGVKRTPHPTHSVAGRGKLALDCLSGHRENDPPVSGNSPLGRLLEFNGKMVWFGAGLSSTTFFHFLENELDLPYLVNAVCLVENGDGSFRTVLTPKNLPGDRDFYRVPAENSKMYRALLDRGLVIKEAALGFGRVKMIEAAQMYELGVKILKRDPAILLCDREECMYCRDWKRKMA